MKTKMGFRYKFAYSFYDFAAYKEFILQGLGKSILYVFLVTLLFSTITNVKQITTFNTDISNIQDTFVHSAPNFKLYNGSLSIDYDEPLYYKYNDILLVVDTTGKTTTSVLDSNSNGIYMDSDSITVKQDYNKIETMKFAEISNLNDLVITNKVIDDFLTFLKFTVPTMLLILKPLISFLGSLASGFILMGPLSMSISALMGMKLKYSKACTLGFYAMTFPLLLEALLEVAGIGIPEFYIVFYMISLLYVGLAIKEIKNIDKSNEIKSNPF